MLFARCRRLRGRGRRLLEAVGPAELLAEPLDAAGGIDELLLAGEKRMAGAANIHRDARQGAAGREGIAASAVYVTDLVFGVGAGFHGSSSWPVVRGKPCRHVSPASFATKIASPV